MRRIFQRALISIAGLAAATITIAAPVRHAPARRANSAAKATPKVTPVQRLYVQLVNNSIAKPDENLAEACRHANAPALIYALEDALENVDFDKGEFETTADFEARMSNIEQVVNTDRTIIVCKPISDETAFIKYDADKGSFSVDDYVLTHNDNVSKNLGSYTSSTRMGIKARVRSELAISYNVDFGGGYTTEKFACAGKNYVSSNFRFPVPSTVAPSVRAGGYVVMLGKLVRPFTIKEQRSGSPTLDDPYDTYRVTLTLKISPADIFMVSPSGERFSCEK